MTAQTAVARRDTYPVHRDEYRLALAQLLDQGNGLSATDWHWRRPFPSPPS
ncbi:MAG: hypothetical protein ACPHUF_04105 [Gammaproteobacteria bacterium]